MGARTTWAIKTEVGDAVTWLYSHWGGDSKFSDTRSALAEAEPRWTDTSYGARIFISQIIGDSWNRETGYGITTGNQFENPFEEEYTPVLVDFTTRTVHYGDIPLSFSEFVHTAEIMAS
jgi:hypothetical protein